jgi:hypothetical protein
MKNPDMNPQVKPVLKKVRAKNGTDIFYTYSNWNTHEIDGVTFLPVVKEVPNNYKNQVIHYMRKDNMEYVK